jgi:hypothetical protein
VIVYPELDRWVLAILAPLAIAILISGIDDLIVDLAWAWTWLMSALRPAASLFPPGPRQLENAPRQRIAIFVPLWRPSVIPTIIFSPAAIPTTTRRSKRSEP